MFSPMIPVPGIVGSGHYATMPGTGIIGENIVRWKIAGAIWRYTFDPPPVGEYFCHHPLGPFWLSALDVFVFRHHDFVLSLPAVVMSALTPPMLYSIGRRKWGVIPGAAAACGFVVLPITLGFAHFHNLEVAVIFGSVLCFWGQVRWLEPPHKKRFLIASLLGVGCAVSNDWPGYISIGVLLGWGLFRAYVLPRRLFERIKLPEYSRWWALAASVAVGSLVLWVALFTKWNKVADWLGSADMRGGGGDVPLKAALESRKYWIDAMFTPFTITIGKIALPVAILRVLARRRDAEVFSLAIFAAAVVQYVGFKRGADVHIFWPHYFGGYYALAFGQLVATLLGVLRWIALRITKRLALAIAAWTALAATVIPTLLVLPDGMRGLRFGRQSGGRYNNNGTIIRSDQDVLFVVEWLRPQIPKGSQLDVSHSIGWGWEHSWCLGTVSEWVDSPRPLGPQNTPYPFWIARASGMNASQLQQVVSTTHARFLGDVVVVDQRDPVVAPLDAYSMNEREPNPFEWYFISGVERMRKVGDAPDPFLTWEWRIHLGQAAPYPTADPRTLDEVRIAHNVAVARGDEALRAHLRAQIDAQIDRAPSVAYDQGMRLVGVRTAQGVEPRLQMWFEAAGPSKGEASFAVHSVVEKKEPFSLMPVDATERNMAYPPPLTPHLWRSGFLYVIETPLFHRTGTERYWGYWESRDGSAPPQRTDGQSFTNLVWVR
jgi:hypothetical protein